jgi:Fur family ferric uptake transcriptional regulator
VSEFQTKHVELTSCQSEADKIRDAFTHYLHEKGLRRTKERYVILECIFEAGGHFNVETVKRKLEEKNFHVSLSSVYNMLEVMKEAGMIVRHQFTAKEAQYELRNASQKHHHAVCSYCGNVKEIKKEKVNIAVNSRIPKFTPEYHSLYIYGMCSKCRFRQLIQQKRTIK